jgi:hypothetical protein
MTGRSVLERAADGLRALARLAERDSRESFLSPIELMKANEAGQRREPGVYQTVVSVLLATLFAFCSWNGERECRAGGPLILFGPKTASMLLDDRATDE